MSVKLIDTSSKEIVPKKSASEVGRPNLRLFLKTAFLTFAVTLGILLVVTLIVSVLVFPKAKNLVTKVENTYSQAQKVEASLKDKDILKSEEELKVLEEDLTSVREDFDDLSFVKFVPILSGYYRDAEHLLNAASLGIELGEHSLEAIEPFGDVLGFKGTKEELKADEKAEKLVTEVIPELMPLVDEIDLTLKQIDNEIKEINENRYPQGFKVKGIEVRQALSSAKEGLAIAKEFMPQVKPLLTALPEIAGTPTEKTYLVLLQNDKELRATGGFITAYALVKVKDGQIIDTESDDIYQLDLKYRRTEASPEAIRKYIGHNSLPIRDANISPDYKVTAMKFESMYNTIRNMPPVDGVFALDTEFVRQILEVTGPVTTKKTKETFSAENNRLGIPDVVYKLELIAEKINAGKNDRKDIVGELMDALIEKITNVETDEFPKYFEAFLKTVAEKHILFYFHNEVAQDFAEKYNAAGQIHDYEEGDYFHLNNSNFGGLKGNIYLKQKVEQNIDISRDGTVIKKIDVTLTNPVRADGWLNSIYLNWMRIYVPEGSKLISEKVQKDFTSGVELGKEVYRGYGATYPLNKSVSQFVYQLPFKVNPNEPYRMLIQKQAGLDELEMIIRINGEEKEHFMLRTDQELEIQY